MRKLVNPHQKAKLALVAMKGDKTFNELASEHQVHPSQLGGPHCQDNNGGKLRTLLVGHTCPFWRFQDERVSPIFCFC